jgi:hypothetical protein
MATQIYTGRKVADIELLDIFPPSEGEITQYYGRIGQGKTYGATSDVLDLLRRGNVVYTNWKINWDGYDERNSLLYVFISILLPWKKRLYNFKKENLRYIPVDENFHSTFEKLTDCYVFLDEGHVVFDSYEMAKLSLARRASILHTRHFNRSICIISQRPTAIHVAMRANVNRFYKMEKRWQWGKIIRFRRTEFQDMQNETVDDDEEKAISIKQYWGRSEVFNAYPSKYLRGETKASQSILFEAYDFGIFSRVLLFFRLLFKGKRASLDGGKVVELNNGKVREKEQDNKGESKEMAENVGHFGALKSILAEKKIRNVQSKRKTMAKDTENGTEPPGPLVSGSATGAAIISPIKLTVQHIK